MLAEDILDKHKLEEVKEFVEILEARIGVDQTKMRLKKTLSFFKKFHLASFKSLLKYLDSSI